MQVLSKHFVVVPRRYALLNGSCVSCAVYVLPTYPWIYRISITQALHLATRGCEFIIKKRIGYLPRLLWTVLSVDFTFLQNYDFRCRFSWFWRVLELMNWIWTIHQYWCSIKRRISNVFVEIYYSKLDNVFTYHEAKHIFQELSHVILLVLTQMLEEVYLNHSFLTNLDSYSF